MSVKASLWRTAALTIIAGAVIAVPTSTNADLLHGMSLRGGVLFPSSGAVRDVTSPFVFGGGIDYPIGFLPHLLNGEAWSTSISADFFYSGRKAGILRSIPVTINQKYTFEEQGGRTSFAGFCFGAYTYGGTSNLGGGTGGSGGSARSTGGFGGHQPTVTRFGGGLMAGMNFSKSLYIEARYEWIDRHHTFASPEGFRAMLGWRF
jgi:hypothetical protein